MNSGLEESDGDMMCCAACGTSVHDIKLEKCDGCKSVRYCSVQCQRDHRPQHKKECKKRAAELREELLFKQPERSHHGDCPICCLPLSIEGNKSIITACCCNVICSGCEYANMIREREGRLQHTCPFCRHPAPKSIKEGYLINVKRAEANNPAAIFQMGARCKFEGDYENAFEYLTKAAELGSIRAHYSLAAMYRNGQGVKKDKTKEGYHFEEAAIGGHPDARYYLGCLEEESGRLEIAAQHWIIAAKLGYDGALSSLRGLYMCGLVGKEDYASALRGHQAAVDATKSPQRDEAEAAQRQWI
eukprot:scaffold10642_cov155-Skeletonema_dohrnii-CCMP3373.AAC.1